MTWMLWMGLFLCVLAITGVGLRAYGARRWERASQRRARNLEAGRQDDKQDGQS